MKTRESPQMEQARKEADALKKEVGPYGRYVQSKRFFAALKAAIRGNAPETSTHQNDDKKDK